jgi:hypothetical protein
MRTADEWIQLLNLGPHPEGGFYRETYRAEERAPGQALPERFGGADRNFGTTIYFMVTLERFSGFHRLRADEVWHYYAGSPCTIHIIYPDGRLESSTIGLAVERGMEPQAVVLGGTWFAAEVTDPAQADHSLVGCSVAPAYEFEDFELGYCADLVAQYPQHEALIRRLTRQ